MNLEIRTVGMRCGQHHRMNALGTNAPDLTELGEATGRLQRLQGKVRKT